MVGLNNAQLEKIFRDVQAQQEILSKDIARNVLDLKDAMKGYQLETSNKANSIKAQQETLNNKVDDTTNTIKSASANYANQFTTLLDQIAKITAAMATQNPSLSSMILSKGMNCSSAFSKSTSVPKDKHKPAEIKIDITPENPLKKNHPSGSKIHQLPSTPQLNFDETQIFDAPPLCNNNPYLNDASPKMLAKTDLETKIKRYFPDFFSRNEAENPSGPLQEASSHNRVFFPPDLLLKFASNGIPDRVPKMQVAMIQAILPYTT